MSKFFICYNRQCVFKNKTTRYLKQNNNLLLCNQNFSSDAGKYVINPFDNSVKIYRICCL